MNIEEFKNMNFFKDITPYNVEEKLGLNFGGIVYMLNSEHEKEFEKLFELVKSPYILHQTMDDKLLESFIDVMKGLHNLLNLFEYRPNHLRNASLHDALNLWVVKRLFKALQNHEFAMMKSEFFHDDKDSLISAGYITPLSNDYMYSVDMLYPYYLSLLPFEEQVAVDESLNMLASVYPTYNEDELYEAALGDTYSLVKSLQRNLLSDDPYDIDVVTDIYHASYIFEVLYDQADEIFSDYNHSFSSF